MDGRERLLTLAADQGGVLTRVEALAVATHDIVDRAVSGGLLVSPFFGAYVVGALSHDLDALRRVALRLRPDAALSHLDALDVWNVPYDDDAQTEPASCESMRAIHLTVPDTSTSSRCSGLTIHRRKGFELGSLTVERKELRVVRFEQAIVESWPLIEEPHRRTPALVSVRDRRTTANRLLSALAENPRIEGAGEMRVLFRRLDDGCHSQLELWGHERVFEHPELPPSRGQLPVMLRGRRVYLDRAFEEEMVDVELDGAAYHSARGQRERDLRRDAELARLGWLVVRFSHMRLFGDPDGVRAELLAILETRRRQFGLTS